VTLTTVLLYCIFALSGAAGLIYETIWTRYLGLFVGHSAYAQILVLGIFLGGMSIGALLVGRRSDRLHEPLVWYAAAELLVGIIGFFFHDIFRAATGFAYATLFPMLGVGTSVTIAKWSIAALLILPQSILLGTTFPLMSAGVLRRAARLPGRILSLLYFANSAGAAAGALLAGFYLLALAGLPGTLLVASALNVVVAAIAYLIGRTSPSTEVVSASNPAGDNALSHSRQPQQLWSLRRFLLFVSFGTAVASFIYEIAWIRMLSLVIGSATHSFELMLSAFILGLALGSLWVHSRADKFKDPIRALGITQLAMGAAALATLPLYAASFGWTATLLATLQRSAQGYTAFNLARYAISLVIMLPATFCAGITLPLITRILIASGDGEKAIGDVYGVNTFGSILGAVTAGLVLMPLLGLKLLLATGAAVDMAIGTLLLARPIAGGRTVQRRARVVAFGAIAFMLLVTLGVNLDKGVMTIGVYRHGLLPPVGDPTRDIMFYRDGRTATVAVVRNIDGSISISTNGKPDGSLGARWFRPRTDADTKRIVGGDAATQLLAPMYGFAHNPAAKNVAVIGFGTGMSTHFLLCIPSIERVETIEIEPAMIDGAYSFYPANRNAYDDRRSHFVIDDAKSHFAVAGERYDLIFSEPSNPWVSGVSSLFTDEFYKQVKQYITPNGVFAQWMHLYEIDDALLLGVLSALHRNFSQYDIFMANEADIVIVASNRATPLVPDWQMFVAAKEGSAFDRTPQILPENMEAARVTDRAALAPLLDRWAGTNSDFYPALDLGAERTRYMQTSATGFVGLATDRFDFLAAAQHKRRGFGSAVHTPFGIPRMRSLALGAWLRSSDSRAAGTAQALQAGDPDARAGALERRNVWELSAGERPASWDTWLASALAVEYDIHAGTAGVADSAFYRDLAKRAETFGAPVEIKAAIAFLHGLAAWDFGEANKASRVLVPEALAGKNWIPVELLHDGAAWSALLTGDTRGARFVHENLGPRVRRPDGDLRMELLEAYILDAERVKR
jgi:spermidine synthase